jgi:uncharacterized RDD family membrane protein YckC
MSLEDRYVTPTPEGVSLDVVLAGLGSRFSAFLIDCIGQLIVFVIWITALNAVLSPGAGGSLTIFTAMILLGSLLTFFGYFIVIESLWSGRTVGKRIMGIRVVKASGGGAGFLSILLRNMARLIDYLPSLYVVGIICILTSTNNQRVGDMLAGTIVIRERHAADSMKLHANTSLANSWTVPVYGSAPSFPAPALPNDIAHWDVSQVSDAEIALIRQFLSRRYEYTAQARDRLADQLRQRISARVAGEIQPLSDEKFLESVSVVKAARR